MGKKQQAEVSRRRPTLQLEGFGRRRAAHIEEETPASEKQYPDGDDSCPWKPVVEEGSGDTYYWNINTGETTWVRPPELGGEDENVAGSDDTHQVSGPGNEAKEDCSSENIPPRSKDVSKGPADTQPLVSALESLGGYESDSGSDESEITTKASAAPVLAATEENIRTSAESKSDSTTGHHELSIVASKKSDAAAEGPVSALPGSPRGSTSRGGSVDDAPASSDAAHAAPPAPKAEGGEDVDASADRDFEELVMMAGLDAEADGEPLDEDAPPSTAAPMESDGGDSGGGGQVRLSFAAPALLVSLA